MRKLIQDRALKAQALRFAAGKRWFPQLEVNVSPSTATAESKKHLTDVDVLISMPDDFEGYRLLLVDCTTSKGSPITRAFWLRGVMDHIGATRGICVVGKDKIEPDHRFNAAQLGVVLLTEDDFAQYTAAMGERRDSAQAHITNIELWEEVVSVGQRYFSLGQTVDFALSGYWMCQSDAEACRKTIAEAIRVRPEVDPARIGHVALILDLAALFMHSLAKIVAKIFASYLQPKSRVELADALLALLYGGRDNYEHLNSLKKMIAPQQAAVGNGKPLTLPEWDRFLQLVRHGLDSPSELPYAPLILREIGWGYLAGKGDFTFAMSLCGERRQAAKMALLGVEYICHAGKLPPDFADLTGKLLLEFQQVPATMSSQNQA